jgi:hypothetical protein
MISTAPGVCGGLMVGSRRGMTAKGIHPPVLPDTYLLVVNPTVKCPVAILPGKLRIAAGIVRLSCPARERADGAIHRAVGFTFNC